MRGLVLCVLAGCAVQAAPAPPASTPAASVPLGTPLVVPGEKMVFEIAFRGLHVGNVTVGVGDAGFIGERPAIIIKSRGETDGVLALIGDLAWELTTTIDLETGTPLSSEEDAVVVFRGKTEHSHQNRGAEASHTVHSSATALRGWRSQPNQKAEFRLRIDEAELDIELHEAAHEFLAAVDKPAVRYDGVARERYPFKLWLSDDASRVPLRLETDTKWGAITIQLVEYTPPRT